MIPVGPLFNHPQTYNPLSRYAGSPEVSLKTLPLILGTTPANIRQAKEMEDDATKL